MTWFTGVAGWGGPAVCNCFRRLYTDPLALVFSLVSPPRLNAEGDHVARVVFSPSIRAEVYAWPDGNTLAATEIGPGERGEESICMGHDGELYTFGLVGFAAPPIIRYDDVIGGGGSSTLVASGFTTNFPQASLAYGLYDDRLYGLTSGYKIGAFGGGALFRVHPVTGARTALITFASHPAITLSVVGAAPVCTLDGGVWTFGDSAGAHYLIRWDIPTATFASFPIPAPYDTGPPFAWRLLHAPTPGNVILTIEDGTMLEVDPTGAFSPFACAPFPATVGGQAQMGSGIDAAGAIVLVATDVFTFPDGPGGFYEWCDAAALFCCASSPVSLAGIASPTTVSSSTTPGGAQAVVITNAAGVHTKYVYDTSTWALIDSDVITGVGNDDTVVAGDDGYFYNLNYVGGSGNELSRWPIVGPGGAPTLWAVYDGAEDFIGNNAIVAFDLAGNLYAGGQDGATGDGILLRLDRGTPGARTVLYQSAAWDYIEPACCTPDGAVWGWAIVSPFSTTYLFRWDGTFTIIGDFPGVDNGSAPFPCSDSSIGFCPGFGENGLRVSPTGELSRFACLDAMDFTRDWNGPGGPNLLIPSRIVADAEVLTCGPGACA